MTTQYEYSKTRIDEQKLIEMYAARLNAKQEVRTPIGDIDLLTDTEIIEVKIATQWKHAVGQVLTYRVYYPTHIPVIYLFGETNKLHEIQTVCQQLFIKVKCVQTTMKMIRANKQILESAQDVIHYKSIHNVHYYHGYLADLDDYIFLRMEID